MGGMKKKSSSFPFYRGKFGILGWETNGFVNLEGEGNVKKLGGRKFSVRTSEQ